MTYRFGTFEFDAREGVLRRAGRIVPIEPKPAHALALLLERPGELITRDELRKRLWESGTHVDFDRSLAYCVSQVRQALGDQAENPRFVQTVPRRGFKFIAPVSEGDARTAHSETRTAAEVIEPSASRNQPPVRSESFVISSVPASAVRSAPARHVLAAVVLALLAVAAIAWLAAERRSPSTPIVAVALFDNETGDSVYDRSLSRMTDSVVGELTALGAERVGIVGNAAVLRQPRASRNLDAVARQTAADFVVLVQLQTRAPDLSLLLQLIRVADGVHVWVRREPLTEAEVDGADERVAARIEAAVRRHVLGEPVATP